MVNHKDMTEYFKMPHQRSRITEPLAVSLYISLLDVEFIVYGGGLTGQLEACIPALARALSNYDVRMKPFLRKLKFTKLDLRRVEPKKAGLIKARKGQVYHRR